MTRNAPPFAITPAGAHPAPPRAPLTSVEIAADEAGQRLDRVLAARIPHLSRSRIKTLIEAGQVTCAGRTLSDPGQSVRPGDVITLVEPDPAPAEPTGETIPLAIVYEDDQLVVLDKPAGLVVHPAAGHATGTLVNALIAHCGDSLSGIGGVRRPGIVHRLDRETSGLLVVAKTDAAHRGLAEQFAAHGIDGRLQRAYQAIVWGVPDRIQGRIEARIGRSTSNRTRMAVVTGDAGRSAATRFAVIERFAAVNGPAPLASLLRLELETGRTHQIRVHLAHIGHPLVGDPLYGQGFKASAQRLDAAALAAYTALGRQALHAVELGFEHPVTGKRLSFQSPLPADISALLTTLRAGKPVKVSSKSRRR